MKTGHVQAQRQPGQAQREPGAPAGHSAPAPASPALATTRDPALAAFLDAFARDLARLARRDRVPGAAAAIVRDGKVIWEGETGVAGGEHGAAVRRETAFQVASLSKPVTALAVMLLAEEGRIDLDRPVWEYLGTFRPIATAHDASGVTARLLLSHRAGFGIHGYPGSDPELPLPELLDSLLGRAGGAGAAKLVADPGTVVLYSSGGYAILQLLVETVAGEPYASFVERRILAPLAMTRSGFEPAPGEPLAAGHGWWGDRLPAFRFTEQAASGLLATAGDYARFLSVLSSPEAQARVGISAAAIESLLAVPAGGGFALGLALDGVPTGTTSGTRLVWHNGSNRGFRAVLGAAPERGDAVVVLTNSDRGMAMSDDLYCSWVRFETGAESAICWAESRRRGTMVAVAALAALGLVMDAAAFARSWWRRRVRSGEAAVTPSGAGAIERHRWTRWYRLLFSLAILAAWWAYWYSDRVALWREGIAHFVPVSAQPPTFVWLTTVVTAWCLLGVARFVAFRQPPGAAAPRRGDA